MDNDGDLVYDSDDTDCNATPSSGRERRRILALPPLLVTSFDSATGALTLSYGSACNAAENTIVFGTLATGVNNDYTGEQCQVGTTGTYIWFAPTNPDLLFFYVVSSDNVAEGSYGKESTGTERPEADDISTTTACPLAQDITNACMNP